ncbi:MAG TPA: hypothetical protein VJ769_03710, partial [Actinomycetes bacterium]|nr:hypothetical protein [Actinomycetes bacterium]
MSVPPTARPHPSGQPLHRTSVHPPGPSCPRVPPRTQAAASPSSSSLPRRASPGPATMPSACAGSNLPGRTRPSNNPGRTSRTPAP